MSKKKTPTGQNVLKKHLLLQVVISLLLVASIFVLVFVGKDKDPKIEIVDFNEFVEMAESGEVVEVTIELGYGNDFEFVDVDGNLYVTQNPKNAGFKRELLEYGIKVNEVTSTSWLNVVMTILRYGFVIVMFVWMMKRFLPKTDTDSLVKEVPNVTFDDVAGSKELKSDLGFVVDYLKDSSTYKEVGANMPKGIVLYGPPGTGKTLMAKAIAGTAGVPFFSASGSDFIEMYVGLGASRVRKLFKKARESAPCIVFIDEIDAVGSSRNSSASHSENNQTINALLNELDGFNGSEGVLVIAATNRLEDLDPALIRPGRFDKQLAVPLPEKDERAAILEVHKRNKKFDESINWDEISATTVGFSGAALASMLNEAALLAARKKSSVITQDDIDRAIYKILMKGDQKEDQSQRSIDELMVCAYHEAGHAIATRLYTKDRIPKVTIISSTSGAGGVTFRTPQEKTLLSKKYIEGCVKLMYAGRAAEQIYFGDSEQITTGASADIKQATKIIKDYIGVYGMSEDFGLINLDAFDSLEQKEIIKKSSEMAKRLYKDVVADLSAHRELLDDFAQQLFKNESLGETEIELIFDKHLSTTPTPGNI